MKKLYSGLAAVAVMAIPLPGAADNKVCDSSARGMFGACRSDGRDDRQTSRVICLNKTDSQEAQDCFDAVAEEYSDSRQLCAAQRNARFELCDKLGQDAYDVSEQWTAANFVDPNDIGGAISPNRWFNLTPGNSRTYFGAGEIIEVIVTDEIKLIEGVPCRTVTDLVTEDGLKIEDTDDWYAQDIQGNVWYCGEIALNYEFYEGDDPAEAEVTDVDGSWKGFRDGAQPGIVFFADPEVGHTYRQEIAWGEAEDAATVLTVTADGLLSGDGCEDAETTAAVAEYLSEACDSDCLVNLEFSPIEPDLNAHKYYGPGVGLLAEVEHGECVAPLGVLGEDEEGE